MHLEVRVTELSALEIWCTESAPARRARRGAGGSSFDMRARGRGRGEADEPAEAGDGARPARPMRALAEAQGAAAGRRGASAGPARREPGAGDEAARGAPAAARATSGTPATARALFDALFELEEAAQTIAGARGALAAPGRLLPAPRHRRAARRLAGQADVADLQRGSGAPTRRAGRLAWWITWRRIAGGLTKGQQDQIYLRLAQLFLPGAKAQKKWDEVKPSPEEPAEMLRCLANLERLSPEAKLPLGDELVRRLESRKVREDGLTCGRWRASARACRSTARSTAWCRRRKRRPG